MQKPDASSVQGCLIFEVIWYIVGYQEITILVRNRAELPGTFGRTHYHSVKPKSEEYRVVDD
jgi:hypothetical protein